MFDTKFFQTMPDGIACYKLVVNQSAAGTDYQYLMVNSSFTALTGLEQTELIGKMVNEVTPELASLCQTDFFTTKTAHLLGNVKQEHYFSRTGRWCLVYVFSPENGYLAIVLNDITPYYKKQLDLAKQNRVLQKRNERMQKKLAQPFRLADRHTATELDGFWEKRELHEEIGNEADVTRKNEIRKRLRRAVAQRRFILQYQPQIEMKTGKIRAVEALLRWNEPGLGWISPLEFIPFAEESGLIVSLGEWVLQEACRQDVLWRKQFGIEILVAVNISAVQLRQAGFVKMVKDLLAETGMPPQSLELEVTESVLIHSFEKVAGMLGELRQIGVRISLDDFGSGYSWLSYLKRLPLDTLKLDKSIINDIHYNVRGKSITNAIVAMVRKLGLTTVAEGVEYQKQFDCLNSSGCDYVQGYLTGRPLFAEDLLKAGILTGIAEI
jgi:EAL domain-containing protein (putative c-di-GMP-specific phosphodiesterase class I)